MITQEWVNHLKDISDFYLKNPLLKLPYSIDEEGVATVFYYDNNSDKLNFVIFVRALGTVDKEYTESSLIVRSLHPKFELLMNREAVCKPLKKEKKLMPAQPAREAYEVEVVTEWDCGSILQTELMAKELLELETNNAINKK